MKLTKESREGQTDYWIMRSLKQDQLNSVPPWQVMDRSHMWLCAVQGLSFRDKERIRSGK